MKLLIAILFIVPDVVVAGPTQCYRCFEKDVASCIAKQQNQTCGWDDFVNPSLGTTNCASAAIKYRDFPFNDVKYGFFRGCIDCADKKEACFALGGYLKAKWKTLLQCEIKCCNGSKCNVQVPTLGLSQKGITVFTPDVVGPAQCQKCFNHDAASCLRSQTTQKCSDDTYSLGTTHCGSATIKYRDSSGYTRDGVIRGCIDCADKRAACAAIGGYLKGNRRETLMECLIECCNGSNCNDNVPPDQAKCNYCVEEDAGECARDQEHQVCSSDRRSLGISHCASMAGKTSDRSGRARKIFFRGCIDCSDKKEACFALGGYLKAEERQTLLQCEIKCCNDSKCNTQVPTLGLSQKGITVFTPDVAGPVQCHQCFGANSASCSARQRIQQCSNDPYSLGTTHCGSATIKYQDSTGNIKGGVISGCIDCADKKAACAAIGGYLRRATLTECLIECCNGTNCNDKAPDQAKCNSCFEDDADKCAEDQKLRLCSSDRYSLGTSHCASIAYKILYPSGRTREQFFRGCIDCSDKKAACFFLGGYLKGDDDDKDKLTLQKCAIECCNGSGCNNQVPTLTQDAINVFTQAASGPKQCNMCLEDDAAKCSNNHQTQVCATGPNSLGTTHCGSAVGKYRDREENVVKKNFIRGCINCADKKAACAAVGGFLLKFRELTQLECEIECCTGDNCNTKFPSKDGSPTKSSASSSTPATQEGHRVLLSKKLAFATVLGVIVYLF